MPISPKGDMWAAESQANIKNPPKSAAAASRIAMVHPYARTKAYSADRPLACARPATPDWLWKFGDFRLDNSAVWQYETGEYGET